MSPAIYEKRHTALLIVDPYNDFMSKDGKLYAITKPTADSVGYYENMRKLIPAVRAAGVQVFIVPHHRTRDDDFARWLHVNPTQADTKKTKAFAVAHAILTTNELSAALPESADIASCQSCS
jgi:nicotinamidase-related amidase